MARKPGTSDHGDGPGTTGHEWDGIEELNTPLPRWWLWTFYGTIIWAVIYTILYPAWPLLSGATPGVLGYATRAEVAAEIARVQTANADLDARLTAADLSAIAADPELAQYADAGGGAVFRTYCAQCHGSGAAGVVAAGYPNLLDDDWLWGGTVEDIRATVTHGIRWDADPDTRFSEMPAFGEILTPEEILSIAHHVLAISGQEHDAGAAAPGAALFADNCASCHGDAGAGNRELGAPNLTDAIWLHGGDLARITETITLARNGRMPAWGARLSEAQIRKVAVYVHGLGGGE
jgi:cytochrome c oxidase cbb3-type subunit 3